MLSVGRRRNRETEENETGKGKKTKQNTNNFHSSEQARLLTPAPAADHSSRSSQLPASKESTSPSYENMSSPAPEPYTRKHTDRDSGGSCFSGWGRISTEISLITTEARSMVL